MKAKIGQVDSKIDKLLEIVQVKSGKEIKKQHALGPEVDPKLAHIHNEVFAQAALKRAQVTC